VFDCIPIKITKNRRWWRPASDNGKDWRLPAVVGNWRPKTL